MVTHIRVLRQDSIANALPWILLLFQLHLLPDCRGQLVGDIARCNTEGEIITIPGISDNPCLTCFCQGGRVECRRESCPTLEGCHSILYDKPRDSCCDACQGCLYEGKTHRSGDIWSDPKAPCKVFSCQAGVLTTSITQCHIDCINPILVVGQCCPVCPGCSLNDITYEEGAVFTSPANPCTSCQCVNSSILCSKSACPVLNCPISSHILPQGSCCPICEGQRRVILPPPRTCLFRKQIMRNATSDVLDPCTSCTCLDGTVLCERRVCPVLDCEIINQDLEQCCPTCAVPQRSCRHRRRSYQHGVVWELDRCTFCLCDNGTIRCHVRQCTEHTSECPRNTRLQRLPGQCCPVCMDVEAVCAVFGDPHYRTFDGKLFNFQGMCNYILAEDCGNDLLNFSIRVRNEPRMTRDFSWTKSVIVLIGDSRIYLLQKFRVKINKKRVELPYIHYTGDYTITQESHSVTLTSSYGMKVIWDGDSYLEVAILPVYKNRMCGLCGNYNNDVADEFVGRDGQMYYNSQLFGQTWSVGRNTCRDDDVTNTQTRESPCATSEARQSKARRQCGILHGDLFEACRLVISVQDYYVSCLTDVCDCPRGKQCACESIMAYSRVCLRENIEVKWRSPRLCGAPQCGQGARWHTCASACPLTCNNWRHLRLCDEPCRGGCQCRPGLLLHNGQCVHPNKCPAPRTKNKKKRKRKSKRLLN